MVNNINFKFLKIFSKLNFFSYQSEHNHDENACFGIQEFKYNESKKGKNSILFYLGCLTDSTTNANEDEPVVNLSTKHRKPHIPTGGSHSSLPPPPPPNANRTSDS